MVLIVGIVLFFAYNFLGISIDTLFNCLIMTLCADIIGYSIAHSNKSSKKDSKN